MSILDKPKLRKRLFIFFILVLLQLSLSWSISPTWTSLGPYGGNFLGTITNPSDASQITAITNYPSYVYQSYNGGSTWNKVYDFSGAYLYDACAYDFSKLFATNGYGCYRSTNGGSTWVYSNFPSGNWYAFTICVDPNDANKVYAAGYNWNYSGGIYTYGLAFFKSPDGGQTWSESSHFTFDYFWVYDITISKTNPNILYVAGYKYVGGSYYGCLLKTENYGTDWSDISSSVDSTPYYWFYSVAVDPTDNNRVYVGGDYFYYSTNGGTVWNKSSSLIYMYALGIDPTNTAKIYGGGYDDIFVSTNYGQNWTSYYGVISGDSNCIEVAKAQPSTLYAATSNGLFKSVNSGVNWDEAHNGISNTVIPAIAIASSQPNIMYVENSGVAVYGTNNSGNTWDYKEYFVACGNTCDLIINPSDVNVILALEGTG